MILVSGGTGMLGSHLLLKLAMKNEKIRAMKRSTSSFSTIEKVFAFHSKNYKQLLSHIEWVDSDITDSQSVSQVMKGIDYVYHTAAIVSFDERKHDFIIKNNILGTQNMVNAAVFHNVKKFCHVSSSAALGDEIGDNFITEESVRNPKEKHSAYSESKYLSELEVWRAINEGLNAVIVNPPIILGAGNWESGSSSMFKTIGKGLKFYPGGANCFVDVMDVVDVMIQLMQSDISSERFIVAGHNMGFKQLFDKIAEALNVQKPSIEANAFMLGAAWRLETLFSRLRGIEPRITKSSVESSKKLTKFSSSKLIDNLGFKFRDIDSSIARIAKNYKNISTYID